MQRIEISQPSQPQKEERIESIPLSNIADEILIKGDLEENTQKLISRIKGYVESRGGNINELRTMANSKFLLGECDRENLKFKISYREYKPNLYGYTIEVIPFSNSNIEKLKGINSEIYGRIETNMRIEETIVHISKTKPSSEKNKSIKEIVEGMGIKYEKILKNSVKTERCPNDYEGVLSVFMNGMYFCSGTGGKCSISSCYQQRPF